MDVIAKGKEQIELFHMLSGGDRVVLGVSGGADSMCLLHFLNLLREEYALTLFAVHVHHGIRGADADADAQFVQRECARRGIVCRVVYEDVPALAKARGCSLEEAGRLVRYQAFAAAAEEWGCSRIAVAHNRDDQAETVLFHAFRGSGLKGLCGIPACRENIIRPLLTVSRAEIEAFLRKEQVAWRTDATNLTEEYTRNRIRHQILPAAADGVNARAAEHLAELAQDMSRVAEYLQQEADAWYHKALLAESSGRCFFAEVLQKTPKVLREQIWLRVLKELAERAEDFGRVHVKQLEELLSGGTGKKIDLPYGITAEKSYEKLYIRRDVVPDTGSRDGCVKQEITVFPCEIDLGEQTLTLSLFTDDRAKAEPGSKHEKNVKIPKNNYTKWFDYDKIGDTLTIRGRLPGDYMVIHKDGRKKSLKSILIDQKVPRAEREQLVLLAAGSRILWCIGVRAEDGLYVDENTKRILVAELKKKG